MQLAWILLTFGNGKKLVGGRLMEGRPNASSEFANMVIRK
jgi:hypothetical protein